MDKISEPSLNSLKKIETNNGAVFHALKSTEDSYLDFGEAYFSSIHMNHIKGWKFHKKMTLNLIVPVGEIRFVIHDSDLNINNKNIKPIIDVTLGNKNYSRLTIPPGYWMAFRGEGYGENILLNIANIVHDPSEAINVPIDYFSLEGFSNG